MKHKLIGLSLSLLLGSTCVFGQEFGTDAELFRRDDVALNAKQNGKFMPVANVTAADELPDKDVYGYLIYERGRRDFGIATFNLQDLGNVTMLYPNSSLPDEEDQLLVASSGAYTGKDYYLFYSRIVGGGTVPRKFMKVNLVTGEYTELRNYVTNPDDFDRIFYDMSYDHSTGKIYGVSKGSTSTLATIDPENGDITEIAVLDELFGELACDFNGQLYGVTKTGEDFYMINKENGHLTFVGKTGVAQATYIQDMEFDHDSDILYWAAQLASGEGVLLTVDPVTGRATNHGVVGGNCEFLALAIPFNRANESAPAAPANFIVNPGANGELTATLSWNNPSTSYGGGALSGLDSIRVYRDGEVLRTLENPRMGARQTIVDKGLTESKLYDYEIVAYNSYGAGASVGAVKFVGRDVPGGFEATLTRTPEGSGLISWTTPATGENEGWYDSASLSYDIVRMPDSVTVASDLTGNTYTDSSFDESHSYYYRLIPSTVDGEGVIVETNKFFLGDPLEMPYFCIFENESESDNWTVINANDDDRTWTFNKYPEIHDDGVTSAEYRGGLNNADDWLISPPLHFESGKFYKAEISARAAEGIMQEEFFEVHVGKAPTVEAMQDYGVLERVRIYSNPIVTTRVDMPLDLEDGEYYIALHVVSERAKVLLQITEFDVSENTSAIVTGLVKSDTGVAVPEATVEYASVDGETVRSAISDENGEYQISDLLPGDYNVNITAYGYHDYHSEAIVTLERGYQTHDLDIENLSLYTVKGILKDKRGNMVANASVRLKGYEDNTVTSKEDGSFEFVEIYEADDYELITNRLRYEDLYKGVNVNGENETIDLGEIVLNDDLLNPSYLEAEDVDEGKKLTWIAPLGVEEYRYDNGAKSTAISVAQGTEDIVIGSVYRDATTLIGVEWYSSWDNQINTSVNVFVFGLDDNGDPTSELLYEKKGVPNTYNSWNSYMFEAPVDCPDGFLIGFSVYNGLVSLGVDDGSNSDYPVLERAYGFGNLKGGVFNYLENVGGASGNLMIRAEGYPMDQEEVDLSYLTYNVYRLREGEEQDKTKWVKLSEDNFKGFEFVDDEWDGLSYGVYKYAVTAMHTGNLESDGAFTLDMAKDMYTTVTINVTSESGNPIEDAYVRLVSPDNIYEGYTDANGVLVVENVWKNLYSITVTKEGFVDYTVGTVDFSAYNEYDYGCELVVEKFIPFNLEVTSTGNAGEYALEWNKANHIFDDFESYEDFTVNPTGEVAWSYVDGDNTATWSFQGISFENQGSKMAYMAFTPSAAQPAQTNITPVSGDNLLVTFTIGDQGQNDDYIISPELSFKKGFVISFCTMSYYGDTYSEIYKIGYSTSSNNIDDFVWSDEYAAPAEWTRVTYSIPRDAKYVAVHCISNNQFIFLIDDMFIGYEDLVPQGVNGVEVPEFNDVDKYEIFLDGEKVGESETTNYLFTGVTDGSHVAGVRAVYGVGAGEMAEMTFDVVNGEVSISDSELDGFYVTPNPAREYVDFVGEYDKVEIYGVGGNLVGIYADDVRTVNISGWAKGIYLVRAYSADNVKTVKLVIE